MSNLEKWDRLYAEGNMMMLFNSVGEVMGNMHDYAERGGVAKDLDGAEQPFDQIYDKVIEGLYRRYPKLATFTKEYIKEHEPN